ncbi:hypothetical protein [Arcanobacterium buesumense]|uniref:Uncharacterized protein n=1 Tax=Arcanobacterium buesumense TaxID=2722751 RepID=A0A6H2EN54_9ACTO|nr:hypothetical protein [Arcanobacterium buesumense]QJC22501.1 hypothetical protein HC352_08300 [Arcanobacterium buesumense]
MNKMKIVLTGLTSVAFMFGSVGIANAQPRETPSSAVITVETTQELENTAVALERLLNYYDSIPDSVLAQGDQALRAWQATHPVPMMRASFWGCLGAIG